MTTTARGMNETEMLNLLRKRFVRDGNGGSGEYAFLTHVRNAAGFNATRTIDAITVSLWPSRGLEIAGYEVKCSRNDWLREKRDPAKADDICRLVDRFWLVTADPSICPDDELPSLWGHLTVKSGRLQCVKDAPAQRNLTGRENRPVSRGFLVSLLRANGAVPKATATEIAAAEAKGYTAGRASGERAAEVATEAVNTLRARVAEFEKAAGITLGYRYGSPEQAAEVGTAFRQAMEGAGALRATERALRAARQQLQVEVERLDRLIGQDVTRQPA